MINRIQNKSFCLHNICVLCIFILIYRNTQEHLFWKYLHVYIYIIYKYIVINNVDIINNVFFLNTCIYIYIINMHSTLHTHILNKQHK